jgi:undecaprenyl-diphosphatase
MAPSTRTALACFAAVSLVVAAIPFLLPLDDAVYRLIQASLTCETQEFGRTLGWVVVAMIALAAVVVLFQGKLTPRTTFLAVFAIVSGALCGELLKTVYNRVRPDGMPAYVVGHALPSGHVMNTTVIAAALWTLADPLRASRWTVASLLFLAVLAQSLSRLLLDAHWATDVVASILLGCGWNAAAPALLRLGWQRSVAIGVVAGTVGLIFSRHPEIRLRLPSVLNEHPPFALEVNFADERARAAVRGDWRFLDAEPIGPAVWLVGAEGSVLLGPVNRSPAWLRLELRPTTRGSARERGCVRLDLQLNESPLGVFTLVRGWRELRLTPPASAWRPDHNVLRLRVHLDEQTRTERADVGNLGLRYVRAGQ